jgi:hypothetical protein
MSETTEPEVPAAAQLPPELQPLIEAVKLYATARGRLPNPGEEFSGKGDAHNFQSYKVALLALERAAMLFAGKSVKQ